jgi:hypothetical protein
MPEPVRSVYPHPGKRAFLAYTSGTIVSMITIVSLFASPQQLMNLPASQQYLTERRGDNKAQANSSHFLLVEPYLRPWESRSMNVINVTDTNYTSVYDIPFSNRSQYGKSGTCTPPPFEHRAEFIQQQCCLGAMSAGGANKWSPNMNCANPQAYQEVQRAAAHVLNYGSLQLQVPSTSMDGIEKCDVCRIVQLALAQNYTIALTGDSVMRQMWDGLLCELARNGYQVEDEGTTKLKSPQGWKHGLGYIQQVGVLVPLVAYGPYINSTKHSNGEAVHQFHQDESSRVKIRYYGQYRPLKNDNTELRAMAEWADILIFNFGVHWMHNTAQIELYRQQMTDVLQEFQNHSFAYLASRETAAQHFPTLGGEYERGKKHNEDCVASIDTGDELYGWRERMLNEVATNLTYQVMVSDASLRMVNRNSGDNSNTLFVIPFLEFTRNLGHLHQIRLQDSAKSFLDCTHYCHSPFQWMPIWRSIRLGLEYQDEGKIQGNSHKGGGWKWSMV